MSDQDWSKMKVAELRDALKSKGLNTTGNKQELIDRLQTASGNEHPELDPKLEDELLKDDDIDEDEKSLLDSTHDLLKSPESSKSSTPETPTPAKKVSLKRNTTIAIPVIEKSEEATEKQPLDASDEPEKKIVKITHLSSQERLELRAKKFAGNEGSAAVVVSSAVSSDPAGSQEKLSARAARFGITAITATKSTDSTTKSAITAPTSKTEELFKKRAERFGAISTDVKKAELDEKLQKRKERFGVAAALSTTTVTADQAEKARLRLERFKTTA